MPRLFGTDSSIGPDRPPQKVAAIINPAKKRWQEARAAILDGCRVAGWPEPLIMTTTQAEPGGPQAHMAVDQRADVILVGGGDGTLREVATVAADAGIPIGMVPLGTANLFAYNVGVSTGQIARNVHIALHGSPRPIDLGEARLISRHPDGGEVDFGNQRFLVLAGIGRDAQAVAATPEQQKKTMGWLAYINTGLSGLRHKNLPMTLTYDDGEVVQRELWSALIGNCGMIRGNIQVIPNARVNDGYLDLLEVKPRNLADWVPIGLKGLLHLPTHVTALASRPLRSVRIEPAEPLSVQLDGDIYYHVVRMDVQVLPGALKIRAAGGGQGT